MADIIEGKRPVVEALRTGVPMKCVLLGDYVKKDGLVEDILRKAKRADVPVKLVPRRTLDERSERGSHQGVLAQAKPFGYVGIGEIVDAAARLTAERDGRALVVPNKRSARVEASTYKSSAGAIAHLPVAQVSNLVQTMMRLKEEGFWIAGATEHASDVIWDVNLKGKIALVMGNEQEGLSRLVMEHCDLLAKLPVEGEVASLNVAQAATACMYEWLRQNY